MPKRITILLLTFALVLSACQTAVSTQEVGTTSVTPATTATQKATATLPATATQSATPSNQVAKQSTPLSTSVITANCTVVSQSPTPGATEQSLFPPVGDSDWSVGPDTAAVTIIEYGDFQ